MRYLICFLFLPSFIPVEAVAQVPAAPKDTVAIRLQLPGADCALFPAAASMGTLSEADSLPSSSRFTPTRAQVASAEKLLPTVRLQNIYRYPASSYYAGYPEAIRLNLAKYRRQYYGFYNAQHQPCLFINFFTGSYADVPGRPATWLRRRIFFFDGGTALWRVCYNLATQQFYDFSHSMEG